jgi:hypothetical protein
LLDLLDVCGPPGLNHARAVEQLGRLSSWHSVLHDTASIGPPYLPRGDEEQTGDECSIYQERDDDPAHPASKEVRTLVAAEP